MTSLSRLGLSKALSKLSEEEWEAIKDRQASFEKEALLQERIKRHKAERLGYTSLAEQDWLITLENIPPVDHNEKVIGRLRKWDRTKGGVVLYGSVGTGKSTLAKAIINQWAAPDYRCKFLSFTDALKNIRSGMDDNSETTVVQECARLVEPSLLILDDLGVDNASEWAREQLFSIFEARSRLQKPTWFTTNMSPDEIRSTYKERIHDRMVEHCSWVKVEGKSFRQLNFKNRI